MKCFKLWVVSYCGFYQNDIKDRDERRGLAVHDEKTLVVFTKENNKEHSYIESCRYGLKANCDEIEDMDGGGGVGVVSIRYIV